MQWVTYCFQHFLEVFPETDEQVKSEMMRLEKCIIEKHNKMEREVDDMIEKAKDLKNFREIGYAFKGEKIGKWEFKGGKEENDIKHDYQGFEQFTIKKELKKILDDVDESEISKDWYLMVQKIQERFIEKFPGWWEKELRYKTRKNCIICKREPNCLEENWLTKEEFLKVKYGPNVNLSRQLKDPRNW